jgi:RNA polymerase sigma factor (sigma-70 family)
MATNPIMQLVRYLRRSASRPEGEEPTDGQLLDGFVRQRDTSALETLVRRHAPMVWGVCRRTLANDDDAEDAFQATFLVLVRKAASIRSAELTANWLYRVAHNTARKARQTAAKRSAREKQVTVLPEPQQAEQPDGELGAELRPLLDEELNRLPEKYRVAVVLCDLEGRTRPEVARQLRLAEGTVGSRLARGRALLARRLARRGLTVSATSLAAALPHQGAAAAVPATLLMGTVQAASLLAGGEAAAAGAISAHVSALSEEVVAAMALGNKRASGILLVVAALVLLGGMVIHHIVAGHSQEKAAEQEKAAAKDGPIKVVITEKWQLPSMMPLSFAEFLDPKNPKCILKKEDIVPDGFMTWGFYGGTLVPAKVAPENSLFFFAMNPNHIRPMMDDLENLDAKLVEHLLKQPNTVLIGRSKLATLNKRVGDKFMVTSLNYKGIDLEFEIVGELPAGRYDQSALMNASYLKQALDGYEKKMGQAHPMADKSLSLVWLRVRNQAAFERVKAVIENAPQFKALPLHCETPVEGVNRLKEAGVLKELGMK